MTAVRAAGVLHRLARAPEPAPRRRARAHQGVGARRSGSSTRRPRTTRPRSGTRRSSTRMDYALLCAYTHPDSPAAELDLVTDWYVWVFFFDDHFLEVFKRTRRPGGRARRYLRPAAAFMPLDLADAAARAGQPGRGAASPTCGRARCRACRRRGGGGSSTSTEHLLDESMWELRQHQRGPGRQPDRVHRDAPQGRRRAVVGGPGRARELRRGARPRRRTAARCACCGTPSPTPCTCATTCSPTSARSRTRASSPTACWCSRRFLGVRHPGGRRPRQRAAHLAPAPVREHRAHRAAAALRWSTALDAARAARRRCCTSRACRTGSPAATSGTCAPAAT